MSPPSHRFIYSLGTASAAKVERRKIKTAIIIVIKNAILLQMVLYKVSVEMQKLPILIIYWRKDEMNKNALIEYKCDAVCGI